MTDLQHEIVPETAPVAHRRSTLNGWVAGGLVVALMAVVGLGAWVYSDHHQTASQRDAVAAVTAFIDAVNSHEVSAVEAAQTHDIAWVSVTNGVVDGPPLGEDVLVNSVEPDWLYSELQLTTVGPPLVVSDSQVVVPTQATFNWEKAKSRITLPPRGSGVVTYTVRDDGSGLKVASVVSVMTGSNG